MAKSSGFLSKLKSSLLGKSEKTEESGAGKFAPKKEEPLDVKFVQTFTEGGGNFMYCTNLQEAVHALEQYAADHQWNGVYISSPAIADWSNHTKLDTTFENDGQFPSVLSTCEALIAFNGGIMIHSHHTGGRKLGDLPKHHVLIAHTSQIVPNLRDGLTAINQKYRENKAGSDPIS